MNHLLVLPVNQSDNLFWNLAEDDPRCMNVSCRAYILGWINDQKRYSNDKFPFYALWVMYFYLAVLGIFMAVHFKEIVQEGGCGARVKKRAIAYWRSFCYRRIGGRLGSWTDLSYGQLALFTAATIFILILPFSPGYFFRRYFRYGSPPLSVRAAFLVIALLPISLGLAGKVNFVTALTGISYAKLSIWHRYTAYMIYILTIIHMVPHFIAPIRDGGWSGMRQLLVDRRREGVFTMIILLSLPYFRNRLYELFKILHILLAVSFLVVLYWHIAAVAISVCNFIVRAIYRNRCVRSARDFIHGFPTCLETLPGGMTRVVVQCPEKLSWKPGQHCYISIPGISMVQSHPFTIVSLSRKDKRVPDNDLVLLVRACKGFTRQVEGLAMQKSAQFKEEHMKSSSSSSIGTMITINKSDAAQKEPVQLRSWIDGAYGDSYPSIERHYNGVICVAGGSGITSSLPWLVYLSSHIQSMAHGTRGLHGEKVCRTRTLKLIWSIRDLSWITWAEQELFETMRAVTNANLISSRKCSENTANPQLPTIFRLQILIYVTKNVDAATIASTRSGLYADAGVDPDSPYAKIEIHNHRPDYMQILPKLFDRKRNIVLGKSSGLAKMIACTNSKPACGPLAQKIDISNSVARLQSMVLQDQVMEISLHTETFGW